MSEDDIDYLKRGQKEREKAYQHLKDIIRGIDSIELTKADKYFLQILEGLIEISKVTGDSIDNLYATTLAQSERLSTLESENKMLQSPKKTKTVKSS